MSTVTHNSSAVSVSTSITSSDLLVEVLEGMYRNNTSTPIRAISKYAVSGDRSGQDLTINIHARRWDEPLNTSTDVIQDTGTGTTDRNGIVTFYWSPDSFVQLDDNFLYYAQVILDSNTSIKAVSNDFYVFDKRQFLKYDSIIPINDLQQIPVYNERSRNTDGGTVFPFTYPTWNTYPKPEITTRYGDTITNLSENEEYKIDYAKGVVILGSPVVAGTEVFATYQFRYFDSNTILSSLDDSIHFMNSFARKNYGMEGSPDFWNPYMKAYVVNDLIEHIWASQLFREKRLIFEDDGVPAALQAIYTGNAATLEDAKKKARAPGDFTPRVLTGGDVIFPFRNMAGGYWIYSASGLHR